jgi:hypothetical protein
VSMMVRAVPLDRRGPIAALALVAALAVGAAAIIVTIT